MDAIKLLPRWARRSHGIRSRRRVWVAASVLLLLLAGCASTGKPEFTELLWPEPPETSRIKFVGILRNQDDLGISAGELFVEALIGRKKRPDSLVQPMAVAPSRDGKRLYVSDYAKRKVFVFDFGTGRVWFLQSDMYPFTRPLGVAVDERDNVYVVDSAERLIRVFDPSGQFLRKLTHESLERPTGIAIDSQRRKIYVTDSSWKASVNHVVHVFDMNGTHLKVIGGKGVQAGKFLFPTYLAVDEKGNLYVTDTLNARVQTFDPEGRYLRSFGERGDAFGMFDKPKGVALDSFGNVYVVDSGWSNVQIFNSRGEVLLIFAGRGHIPGALFNPTGIAIDRDNRIYVADAFNARVAIYQLVNTKAEDSFLPLPPRSEKGGDSTRAEKKEAIQKAPIP